MFRKAVLVAAIILALGITVFRPAVGQAQDQGGGVGIFPVFVELHDAMRGSQYPRTITLINNETWDLVFKMERRGEVSRWAVISTLDAPDVPLTEIAVPAKSQVRLKLAISIPEDAANGQHTGSIAFVGDVPAGDAQQEDKTAAMGVIMGVGTDLIVDVTGTQILTGQVGDLWVDDVEVDQPPLRVRAKFENSGNVNAVPVVQARFFDAGGAPIGEAAQRETVVPPQSRAELRAEWDHTGVRAGDYKADVTISLGGQRLDARSVTFHILPRGALTSAGVLEALNLTAEERVGALAKVVARFRNTGQIDVNAVLIGEVYRAGSLLEVVESREKLVAVGDQGLLELYFKIPEAGDYTLRGKVNYSGKETEIKEVTFTMPAAAPQTEVQTQPQPGTQTQPMPQPAHAQTERQTGLASQPAIVWALGGVLALVLLALLVTSLRKKPAAGPAHRSGFHPR